MTQADLTKPIKSDRFLVATPPATDIRVLHIEDNPSDAILMQEYLQGSALPVTFDDVKRLAEVTPARVAAADCALLDLSLPDASGLDALHALRALSDWLPIVVLTGYDDSSLGLAAVREGADDYIVKNHVHGYLLERAVQYAIERRRLLLELDNSIADSIVAEASTTTVDVAMSAVRQLLQQTMADGHAGALNSVVAGTHVVSTRIDRDTCELMLECHSCDWVSEQSGADGNSWVARALEEQLLRHVYFGGFDEIPGQLSS